MKKKIKFIFILIAVFSFISVVSAFACEPGYQDMDHNGSCQSVCEEKEMLQFSPPPMVDPIIITNPADGNPQGGGVLSLSYNHDYIIYMPTDRVMTKPFHVRGGRNVRIVGGHWALTSGDAALIIDSPSQSIFLEGGDIDGSALSTVNGVPDYPDLIVLRNQINYGGPTTTSPYDVYIQNYFAIAKYGRPSDMPNSNHTDILQDQSEGNNIGNIYIENFTGIASDQALFFGNSLATARGIFHFRNVNLSYGTAPLANGALIWTRNSKDDPVFPGTMENVYVGALPGTFPWYETSVWPQWQGTNNEHSAENRFDLWGTILSGDEKSITFMPVNQITGEVRLGPPPNGSFVFPSDVGLNYSSPHEVVCPVISPSDLNADGLINVDDFNILKSDFQKLTASLLNPKSDINADGQCTVKDAGILMSGWKP